MNILFISDTYYPHINGVYYFVRRLAGQLQKNGYKVAVITASETREYKETCIDNIQIFGISSLSFLLYKSIRFPIPFIVKPRIISIIKNFKPDIIHIQNHFLLNRIVMSVNRKFSIPVVATNHFMTENFTAYINSPQLKKIIDKWMWVGFIKVFNRVAVVTTPTVTGITLIRSKLSVKIIAISNGIDLKNFTPGQTNVLIRRKYGIPEKPILLYVGRLDPEKHLSEVLQAVAMLKETDFCFVIVGKGVERTTLEKLAKRLNILEKIIFTGFTPDEDLLSLYQLSQCFVIASIAELQSISTLEAMASGLPVIAANSGALIELVHNEENGYLFSPGDIQSLAQHIRVILNDENLRKKMSSMSLKYIEEHDINKTVSQFEELYKTVKHEYGSR